MYLTELKLSIFSVLSPFFVTAIIAISFESLLLSQNPKVPRKALTFKPTISKKKNKIELHSGKKQSIKYISFLNARANAFMDSVMGKMLATALN